MMMIVSVPFLLCRCEEEMNHHHPSQVTFSIHTCTCTHPTIDLISPHAFRSHSRFLISVSSLFFYLYTYIISLYTSPPHTRSSPHPLSHTHHHQLPPSNHPPYSRAFELLKIRQLISNHLGAQSKKEGNCERKQERKKERDQTRHATCGRHREGEGEREREVRFVCL